MSFTSPFTGDVIQPTDVSYASYNLTANLQLQWPSNTNGLQYPAARIMDVYQNASWTIKMPDATQVSVGQDALIRNISGASVSILNFAGSAICTITAGQSQYIYLTSNSTAGGNWGVIAFGSTTSSANATDLAGLGLVAITTTLNQSHPVASIANGYTFVAADRAQTKLWSSGAGTFTLPLASTLGNNWFTIFKNNGTGSINIATTSSQLIDGNLTKTFLPSESAFIICDGTSYYTIGYGQSNTFFFTALVYPVTGGSYLLTSADIKSTIQEYVGILASNVTITYPQVVNLYVVSNQTTDNGYTLTLTTGVGGSASAIIPPGQQATLICDGTNFFNANTVQAGATTLSLINGTVTTPAINFAAETNTGLWRSGYGKFDISILGVNRFELDATGLSVVGKVAATGNVTGVNISGTGTGNFVGGVLGGTF
jgi:hypothetical protein